MPDMWIGIDPGVSGFVVFLSSMQVQVQASPTKTDQNWHIIIESLSSARARGYTIKTAAIEKVHSFPAQGVRSVFTFGESFGKAQGILLALKVPFQMVSPARWMAEFSFPVGATKRDHAEVAKHLFPDVKVTQANADALLLAEYARRKL